MSTRGFTSSFLYFVYIRIFHDKMFQNFEEGLRLEMASFSSLLFRGESSSHSSNVDFFKSFLSHGSWPLGAVTAEGHIPLASGVGCFRKTPLQQDSETAMAGRGRDKASSNPDPLNGTPSGNQWKHQALPSLAQPHHGAIN